MRSAASRRCATPWQNPPQPLLLIDSKKRGRFNEADSFLQDRRAATRSWEITLVNEVLKQLEEHAGYVILSTNLYDHLDHAVLRRLDLKVTFGYLIANYAAEVFRVAAEQLGAAPADIAQFCGTLDWRDLQELALSDVAVALRQVLLITDTPTPGALMEALKDQLAHRYQRRGRRIGF